MTEDQIRQTREFLKQRVKLFDTSRVTEFEGYRDTRDGSTQHLRISVLDAGAEAGDTRFHCRVQADNWKTAYGNSAGSVEIALSLVHWENLDK